jgi:hypothetical protein
LKGLIKKILKNTIGAILVILGLIMLVTPGQGLLTILLGLSIMEFPGKKTLIAKLKATKFYAHRIFPIEEKIRKKFKRG